MDVVTESPRTAPERPRAWSGLRILLGPRALPRWAMASLVANIGIVVTGGLVRLTGSGLGCPTWPRCSADSYVTHPALGYHGLIEFGNRMLTFAIVIIALLTFVTALLRREHGHSRRGYRWLAGGLLLGIPAQAVIGGISVLYRLNPYIVALHLLVSMLLIALAVWLVRMTWHVSARPAPRLPTALARVVFALLWGVVILGTAVTGSGPHAGDEHVARMLLDGALVTHLHAALVYAAVAGSVVCLVLLRSRAAVAVVLVEVGQAALGLTQYHLGLPIGLVALHLLGACLTIAAATNLVLSVSPAREGEQADTSSASVGEQARSRLDEPGADTLFRPAPGRKAGASSAGSARAD